MSPHLIMLNPSTPLRTNSGKNLVYIALDSGRDPSVLSG
jgi:hypothetical protein